jgi:hypothetical protein
MAPVFFYFLRASRVPQKKGNVMDYVICTNLDGTLWPA